MEDKVIIIRTFYRLPKTMPYPAIVKINGTSGIKKRICIDYESFSTDNNRSNSADNHRSEKLYPEGKIQMFCRLNPVLYITNW
jgi:hypothetical protein